MTCSAGLTLDHLKGDGFMGTKLEVACSDCPTTGVIELPFESATFNVGGSINITNQPCPECGGKMSAGSGKYETDEGGMLRRVGDFQP